MVDTYGLTPVSLLSSLKLLSRTQDKTYCSKHSSRRNSDNKSTPQMPTCYVRANQPCERCSYLELPSDSSFRPSSPSRSSAPGRRELTFERSHPATHPALKPASPSRRKLQPRSEERRV